MLKVALSTKKSNQIQIYFNSTDGPRQVVIRPATSNYTRNETLDSLGPINCTVNCKPACTSTWNGPNIPPGITSVLSLAKINRNQAGNYQCTASNDVSSLISATVYVVVNCKYHVSKKHPSCKYQGVVVHSFNYHLFAHVHF